MPGLKYLNWGQKYENSGDGRWRIMAISYAETSLVCALFGRFADLPEMRMLRTEPDAALG